MTFRKACDGAAGNPARAHKSLLEASGLIAVGMTEHSDVLQIHFFAFFSPLSGCLRTFVKNFRNGINGLILCADTADTHSTVSLSPKIIRSRYDCSQQAS